MYNTENLQSLKCDSQYGYKVTVELELIDSTNHVVIEVSTMYRGDRYLYRHLIPLCRFKLMVNQRFYIQDKIHKLDDELNSYLNYI